MLWTWSLVIWFNPQVWSHLVSKYMSKCKICSTTGGLIWWTACWIYHLGWLIMELGWRFGISLANVASKLAGQPGWLNEKTMPIHQMRIIKALKRGRVTKKTKLYYQRSYNMACLMTTCGIERCLSESVFFKAVFFCNTMVTNDEVRNRCSIPSAPICIWFLFNWILGVIKWKAMCNDWSRKWWFFWKQLQRTGEPWFWSKQELSLLVMWCKLCWYATCMCTLILPRL